MNIQSIILLIAIVLLFVYVVYGLIKNRKRGGPCSGCSNAGSCGGGCGKYSDSCGKNSSSCNMQSGICDKINSKDK